MRVLTLTTLYPNPLQPHRAAFNRQQLRALSRRHDVNVIAPIAWTDELFARWNGPRSLPRGEYRSSNDGPTVEHTRYWFLPRTLRGLHGHWFRWSVRRAFQRAVSEFVPDVIYAPWAYPDGWAAVKLGREAGLPVVLKVLGSDVRLLAEYQARAKATQLALRQANRVVAVSRDLAERVADLGADPARIRVVYDGIDSGLFRPGSRFQARSRLGLRSYAPLILFVGNLLPVKGPELLIEACGKLAHEGIEFGCCLVGQGPLRTKLERLIRDQGLGARVTLCGPVHHEQLPDWFRAASVLALPSLSEGVPNVLLEALACGTPFVASKVGGVPEIAHLGPCRLVPAGNAGLLAQALRPFLSQSESETTATNTRLPSWDDSAAELAEVLEEAIHGARTPVTTH
jgi:glycosyltransferase involved in cell wall biosynthesis